MGWVTGAGDGWKPENPWSAGGQTMKSTRVRRWLGVVALSSMFLAPLPWLGTAGAAWAQQAGTQARSDAEIEGDIVDRLAASPTLRNQAITAATIQGDVTLSGNVKDAATKELAESVVGQVSGVRSVENNLVVGFGSAPSPEQPMTDQGDAQQAPPPGEPQAPMPSNGDGAGNQRAQSQGVENPGMSEDGNPEQAAPPPYPGQYPRSGQAPRPPYQPSVRASQPSDPADQMNGPAAQATGPVTVPQGTLLRVRTREPLDSSRLQPGTVFEATAASDVYAGDVLAIPRGATLSGTVVDVKSAGALKGNAALALQLTSLNLEGHSYPLATDVWNNQSPGKGGYSAGNTAGGAAIGAVIGAIAGGGPGAAIGAVAGGATGAAASAATSGPRIVLPPEALLNFHLSQAVTVTPASYREAQRLASNLPRPPGARGPYPRARGPYAYPYPPPPPYGYPYPYYRRYYYPRYYAYGW